MKTVKQIEKKAESLKRKLISKKQMYENFGQKEYDQLMDYIGDLWEYGQNDRKKISSITSSFFSWAVTYTG